MDDIYEEAFVAMVKKKIEERNNLPLEYQILRFLAETAYATENQLVRLFEREFSLVYIEKEIRSMKETGKMSLFTVDPPKHLKIELAKIRTLYATELGRSRLASVDQEAARYGRFGKPEGENLKRVTHELLATESYIWFTVQGYEVLWFIHENQLKKSLGRKRWERLKQNKMVPFDSETTGDYKICVTNPKNNWKVDTFECEVAVRYNREQIGNKPKNMKWFCLTTMQGRMIEAVTGEEAIVLGEFIEHEQKATARKVIKQVQGLEIELSGQLPGAGRRDDIVGILENTGGGCTGKIIAHCLKISYSQVRVRQRLFLLDDRITIDKGVVMPGITRGRSMRVWHLSALPMTQTSIKLLLLRSLVLENFFKTGWNLDQYNSKLKSIVLRKPTHKVAFKIDEFQETDETVVAGDAEKVNNVIRICAQDGIRFKYVCIDKERLRIFSTLIPKINLIDLTSHDKLNSVTQKESEEIKLIQELDKSARKNSENQTGTTSRITTNVQVNGKLPF